MMLKSGFTLKTSVQTTENTEEKQSIGLGKQLTREVKMKNLQFQVFLRVLRALRG